ncbi:hypothetical protein ABLE91_23225 [Aquabacter sp. CN5-332]|uniref:hypothetical protein n=1 Tax=Aquabacter sp. CN5-332 TaxID=3156608 RepID=UPI0032B4C940
MGFFKFVMVAALALPLAGCFEGPAGPQGPQGPQGAAGPAGPAGAQGAAAKSPAVSVRSTPCPNGGCTSTCETGEQLMGGYCVNQEEGMQHVAVFSSPNDGAPTVKCENPVKQVVAVCLKP